MRYRIKYKIDIEDQLTYRDPAFFRFLEKTETRNVIPVIPRKKTE